MSSQNFRIERLQLHSDQVSEIIQMLAEFYDNDYETDMINRDSKDIDRHSFVALTKTNTVAGFILVQIPRRNPNIVQFLVSANFRGQGLGKILLQKAIEDIEGFAETMDGRPYQLIYLDVPTTAEVAKKLYESNGFVQSTKAAKQIGTKAHRMERKITLK